MGWTLGHASRFPTKFRALNLLVPSGRASRKNVNLGVGCVVLFLIPFAAIGAFMAVIAVQRAAARNWSDALFLALVAITFGGVGLGGIAAVLAGRRRLREQAALEASQPDSPWLWRPDWASGRILDASRVTMFAAWVFAALWSLISFPAGFLGVRAAIEENKPAALLALLFPLVGLGLLVWAVRSTLRYRKYGVSRLELSSVPCVIGRTMVGMVRAPARMQPDDGFQVTLSCVRLVTTGGGEDRPTSERILWQEEQRVLGESSRTATAMETHISVAFRLPADAEPCDDSDPDSRVVWRLHLTGSMPGVDYQSHFEVPVFRTPASDQPLSADEKRITQAAHTDADYQQPLDSRIVVTSNTRGTEILFPAARNPGAATSLTLFLLLWLGCIALQMYFHAPLLFPIVTGLFGVLILIGVLDLWLEVSRVSVDAGTLTWAKGYIFPAGEHTVGASEIAGVTASIGMQAGTTPYYDVEIVRKNSKKIKVGRSVRNKQEAEWLARKIREAISA